MQDGGKDIPVDASNVEDYIHEVLDTFMGRGVQFQAQAFREGFSKVFPVTDLQAFSSDELSMMFGNEEEDWSAESESRPRLFPVFFCSSSNLGLLLSLE